MHSVSIIGVGRVGGALALALSDAGYDLRYLVHRDPSIAERIAPQLRTGTRLVPFGSFPQIDTDIVIIATADPDISAAAERLAVDPARRQVVLHTSGSLSSKVLRVLAELSCSTGSMHPLVSISDPVSGAAGFAKAYFCIEGDAEAVETATAVVKTLGGRPFSIPSDQKPLYHAAAVTACGHLVALIDIAIEMLSKCGLDETTSKEVLLPLIESTVGNLQTQTPSQALTGSFARADLGAVERHLAAIGKTMPPPVRDVYLLLGERSLDLAAANGAEPSDVQKLRERVLIAKRKPEC